MHPRKHLPAVLQASSYTATGVKGALRPRRSGRSDATAKRLVIAFLPRHRRNRSDRKAAEEIRRTDIFQADSRIQQSMRLVVSEIHSPREAIQSIVFVRPGLRRIYQSTPVRIGLGEHRRHYRLASRQSRPYRSKNVDGRGPFRLVW